MKRLNGKLKFTLAMLSVSLLAACSSSGGGETPAADTAGSDMSEQTDNTNEGTEGTEGTTGGADNTGNTDNANPGTGNQVTGNFLLPCRPNNSLEISLEFIGDELFEERTSYEDEACTQPEFVQSLSYTVSYPGGSTTTDKGEAAHIDLNVTSLAFDGQPATGLGSDSFFYTIILLDGVNLYFGEDFPDDVADRPDMLGEFAYIRQ